MSERSVNGIERWIRQREPVEQDELVEEFGRSGLSYLRKLMIQNRVSYTLDWKLQTESNYD